MAETSNIEWTDATWNPVRGCTRVSEGCRNCYAEQVAARFSDPGLAYHGFAERSHAGSKWTGQVELVPHLLTAPLRWSPRRIFVNSMSDLFHESLSDEAIDDVFGVMALCPQHIFQVLTKRPERMRRWATQQRSRSAAVECVSSLYVDNPQIATRWPFDAARAISVGLGGWPLPNVWLGTSVENQATADERIPHLLATPAAKRFLSCEPLLGAIDLNRLYSQTRPDGGGVEHRWGSCLSGKMFSPWGDEDVPATRIDWVIVGGESGPDARPMHPDWARNIRDQCQAAGVRFFFKQWGEWKQFYDREADDPDWRRCPKCTKPGERYHNLAGGRGFHGERVIAVRRVGKKAAGAHLDGREWREMPT